VATKRHKSVVVTQSSNTKVSTFFKSIVPDKNDMAIALQEGAFAFHTVQHHQSFKPMDCSSRLIKEFFEPKFTCSRTKVEAITKHVLSPWAYEEVTEEIKKNSFVTMLIDATNHGHVKLLPILIRYVLVNIHADKTENDSCVKIITKIVHFVEIAGETAEILSQSALQAIRKLGLENKVIAISDHQF
jgi:hypothetical protein